MNNNDFYLLNIFSSFHCFKAKQKHPNKTDAVFDERKPRLFQCRDELPLFVSVRTFRVEDNAGVFFVAGGLDLFLEQGPEFFAVVRKIHPFAGL